MELFLKVLLCAAAGAVIGGILGFLMFLVIEITNTAPEFYSAENTFYGFLIFTPINALFGALIGTVIGAADLNVIPAIITAVVLFILSGAFIVAGLSYNSSFVNNLYLYYPFFWVSFFPMVLTAVATVVGKNQILKLL